MRLNWLLSRRVFLLCGFLLNEAFKRDCNPYADSFVYVGHMHDMLQSLEGSDFETQEFFTLVFL